MLEPLAAEHGRQSFAEPPTCSRGEGRCHCCTHGPGPRPCQCCWQGGRPSVTEGGSQENAHRLWRSASWAKRLIASFSLPASRHAAPYSPGNPWVGRRSRCLTRKQARHADWAFGRCQWRSGGHACALQRTSTYALQSCHWQHHGADRVWCIRDLAPLCRSVWHPSGLLSLLQSCASRPTLGPQAQA